MIKMLCKIRFADNKAFTLIELLVVVAIIGILAAVGVVAYNGYTGAAKVSAVKSIYTSTVKYISAESTLCSLGDTTNIISGCLKCSDIASGGATKLIICMENTSKDINPYSSSDWPWHMRRAVNSGKDNSDKAVGKILINSENSDTAIFTSACFKTPCSDTNNRLSTTININ
jgi:type IV pilus assembly protein PilA